MAEYNYNREMDKSDRVMSIIALWACWTSEAAEVIVYKYKYKNKLQCKCKNIKHKWGATKPGAFGRLDPIWGPLFHIFVDEKKNREG